LLLGLLLGRIKTTSSFHLFKRKRVHQLQLQEAEAHQLRDFPVLELMGFSRQRHDVLKRKLVETHRMLTRHQSNLTTLEKRRAQLNRAMGEMHTSLRTLSHEGKGSSLGSTALAVPSTKYAMARLLKRSDDFVRSVVH